jgi:hypothetical protein
MSNIQNPEIFDYKGVFSDALLIMRVSSRRIAWWDLMHLSEIQVRSDTRGLLVVHGIAIGLISAWYCTTIQTALHGTYIKWMELAAFLVSFKLVLISLGIFFLKDYIKSTQ